MDTIRLAGCGVLNYSKSRLFSLPWANRLAWRLATLPNWMRESPTLLSMRSGGSPRYEGVPPSQKMRLLIRFHRPRMFCYALV